MNADFIERLDTAAAEFRDAIARAGLRPPSAIIPDGGIHRFSSDGRPDDDAGWYVFFSDSAPAGAFGCWRTGIQQHWSARSDRHMTAAERAVYQRRVEQVRQQRRDEEARRHAEAAEQASALWRVSEPAPADFPYLIKKGVQPHGLRLYRGDLVIAGQSIDGSLIVPLRDTDGRLCSLEFIAADGDKLFLPGGRKRGASFLLGTIHDVLCIAEGFATGASIYKATSYATAVAFDAGNLRAVAEAYRAAYPTVPLIICGDHDVSGVGQAKSQEAAVAVGARIAIPETPGCDWNDIAQRFGIQTVKEGVMRAVNDPGAQDETRAVAVNGGWPHPAVAGEPPAPTADVLDDVYAFLGRFIAYPSEHARIAHTLWIAHTHLMDAWESTPRLAFLSPEPGSGKTRALEVTETLTPRPVEAVNATPAYLFRKISDPDGLPTILFDEIDTVFGPRAKEHEEIRGVMNAGHRRGAMAGRCVVKGKTVTTEELPAFCAVAMAGIGNLPDTILTRSVIVRMRRRAPHEQVEPYRRRLHAPEGHKLRDRLTAWARVVRPGLNLFPAMPDGIADRQADVWESLLCVADAAGSDWPERARAAAVALVADAAGETPSLGVRLLADIRAVLEPGSVPLVPDVPDTMGSRDRLDALPTHELLTCLTTLEEAPWGDLRGKPLDARRLANLLKPYGIHSKKIRVGGQTAQGYERADFLDAWARYLPAPAPVPSSPLVSGTSGTSGTHGTDPAADLPEGEVEEVELW